MHGGKRSAVIYGFVIVVAVAITAVILSRGDFRAATKNDPILDGDCVTLIEAGNDAPLCACSEGDAPKPVPESVEASRTAAVRAVEPLPSLYAALGVKVKNDIESGSIAEKYKSRGSVTYNSRAEAESAIKSWFKSEIVPALDTMYKKVADEYITSYSNKSFAASVGHFNFNYVKDLDKFGPQVSYNTTFNTGSDLYLRANSKFGLNTFGDSYATTNISGTWFITGENIFASASYDCDLGTAKGEAKVKGGLSEIKVSATFPVSVKLRGVPVTIRVGVDYTFGDKLVPLVKIAGWNF